MQTDTSHYIYALINPRNHYPFYVGMTSSLEMRYEQHLESHEGKKRAGIIKGLAAAGLEPAIIVLERKPNRKLAKLAEVFWIELFASRGIPIANKEILGSIDVVDFHLNSPPIPESRGKKGDTQSSETTTDELKRQNHPNGPLPANHGKAWTKPQIESLKAGFEAGASIDDLAEQYARTYLGILGQLQRLASSSESVYGRLANLGLLKSQAAYRQLLG